MERAKDGEGEWDQITRGLIILCSLLANNWEHAPDLAGRPAVPIQRPGPRPIRNLPPRPAHVRELTFGVQPAAAAGAGPARPQEAGPPLRPRAHAEEPEGSDAGPGRELQQRPERRGGRGGAEARGGGTQRPGHAAQQRKHREGDRGSCRGRHVRRRTT